VTRERNPVKGKEEEEEWGRKRIGILVKGKKGTRNGVGKGEESW
jgi:hypothetical protein